MPAFQYALRDKPEQARRGKASAADWGAASAGRAHFTAIFRLGLDGHTARQNKACLDKLQFHWRRMMAKLLLRRRNRGRCTELVWRCTEGGRAAGMKRDRVRAGVVFSAAKP
jgi:hypothetical protein